MTDVRKHAGVLMNKPCTIPNCIDTTRIKKGLCGRHYCKLRKYGNPLFGKEYQRKPYDKHLGYEICERIKLGESILSVVKDMPFSRSTVYGWQISNREFRQDYQEAQETIRSRLMGVCAYCRTPKKLTKENSKYCSHKCYAEQTKQIKLQERLNLPRKSCKTCGFEMIKTNKQSQKLWDRAVVCSKECTRELHRKQFIGNKNPNYKGGITEKSLIIRGTAEYKDWRKAVFERDNYTCLECGDNKGGNLEADHIKPFAFFPELRMVLTNGRTLCKPCHKLTPTWGKGATMLYAKSEVVYG